MKRGLTRRTLLKTGAAALAAASAVTERSVAKERKTMIIDSHCHAWDYWPYNPPVPDPKSRGAVEQLLFEMDRRGVDQATIVCAEIDHNPDNNQYVADCVKRFPDRLHQFADVDSSWKPSYHSAGAARRMEDTIARCSPAGFTHYLRADDDGAWLNAQDGIDFLGVAAEAGMIASIACYPRQHAALRKVAERFPDMPILCHHMSMLKGSEPDPKPKLKNVLESAKLPNMYLKLSGFHYVSEAQRMWEYPYAEVRHVYEACYDAFGPRMVWGSDYPVVRQFMTYQQALEAFRTHCDFVSEADKAAILGGTLAGLLAG